MTIDDVAATITEGVVNVPYTAAKMVVSGSAVTVHGTETISDTYTIDVDHEPLRIVNEAVWAITDQINKIITGERPDGQSISNVSISRNGSRATWAQRSRYSYKTKFDGDENWSDALSISLNFSGCAIGYLTDKPFDLQVFYDYDTTHEQSPVYHIDVTSATEHLENITLYSETEGVTIDNTSHTVSVTAAATDNIDMYVKEDDALVPDGNIYYSFSNKWIQNVRSSAISTHLTAADIAGADYIMPAVTTSVGRFTAQGPVYAITVTITE